MGLVSIADIEDYLEARIVERWGLASVGVLSGVSSIVPGDPECLSFLVWDGEAALKAIEETGARVVLVRPAVLAEVRLSQTLATDMLLLAVEDPRREFVRTMIRFFNTEGPPKGVHPAAVVEQGAVVGVGCEIGPGAFVASDVRIGDGCMIGANTVLASGTSLGVGVSIGPNCSIGEPGFGYVREPDGDPLRMPHLGRVVIEDGVGIGSNTCIDRGALGDTVIRRGAKIDNLVHVAHNCDIGEGAFVIATAILGGSVKVGPRAWIAPNATIREHLRIGADAKVGLASNVVRDVGEGSTVFGNPARTAVQPRTG